MATRYICVEGVWTLRTIHVKVGVERRGVCLKLEFQLVSSVLRYGSEGVNKSRDDLVGARGGYGGRSDRGIPGEAWLTTDTPGAAWFAHLRERRETVVVFNVHAGIRQWVRQGGGRGSFYSPIGHTEICV